jgi:hypothetical protein
MITITPPTLPTKTLLQGCEYVPAAKTDVTQTWRRFGWVPTEKTPVQALELPVRPTLKEYFAND